MRKLDCLIRVFLTGLCSFYFACDKVVPLASGQMKVESIWSASMKKRIATIVVVPESYNENEKGETAARRYPVIYLLHGYGGNYGQWHLITNLAELASRYEFILVCPDGGGKSWYIDSPIDSTLRYETFVMREVIPYIDSVYATAGPSARAITGLSMGGHGALRFLALYPDSFVAAGSMSGILDLRVFPESWQLSEVLGNIESHPENWAKNSAVNFIQLLHGKSKRILVDCGTEDFALGVNRAFRDSAAVHGIEITFEEHPGGHEAIYWQRRLQPHLVFFRESFRLAQGLEN